MHDYKTQRFIRNLRDAPITAHQRKTLRGQALAGNLDAAQKGLSNLLRRRNFYQYTKAPG